jgi:hypothetical protein
MSNQPPWGPAQQPAQPDRPQWPWGQQRPGWAQQPGWGPQNQAPPPGQQPPPWGQPWPPQQAAAPRFPATPGRLPGPQAAKPRPRARNAVLALVGGLLVLGVIGAAINGGKTPKPMAATRPQSPAAASAPTRASAATSAATPQAVAKRAPAPANAARRILAWYHHGGHKALDSITADLGAVSQDAGDGDYPAVGHDCAALSSDIATAQADGPVPYHPVEKWFARALSKYGEAAAECQAGAGTEDVSSIEQATAEFDAGSTDLAKATKAITSLIGS